MKSATEPKRHYPPHFRHVAALPRKIKNPNFCRYSAHMEENANTLHFKCTTLNSTMHYRLCVYSGCIYVLLSKSCPYRWIPCSLFINTAVTSAVTNCRCHKLI